MDISADATKPSHRARDVNAYAIDWLPGRWRQRPIWVICAWMLRINREGHRVLARWQVADDIAGPVWHVSMVAEKCSCEYLHSEGYCSAMPSPESPLSVTSTGSSSCGPRSEPPLFVPADTALPFFAYGLFKPDEPLYRFIKRFVDEEPIRGTISGSLCVRDGLPLLKFGSSRMINGYVIRFAPGQGDLGYAEVGAREPRKQYRWQVMELIDPPGCRANALVGRRPDNGSVDNEGSDWHSRDDAILRDGLVLIDQIASEHGSGPFGSAPPEFFEWARFFMLQMAYLFLWTVIERYVALAYGPDLAPGKKVGKLGEDPLFGVLLRTTVRRRDELFDTQDPGNPYRLNAAKPQQSVKYYFQVRNNVTHRGKGAWQDAERVRQSLQEPLTIVRQMIGRTPGTLFKSLIVVTEEEQSGDGLESGFEFA
jgi:hypothetical protein